MSIFHLAANFRDSFGSLKPFYARIPFAFKLCHCHFGHFFRYCGSFEIVSECTKREKALIRLGKYSRVPNRRVGWNKRVRGKIAWNLINKLDGIKELVGNCTKAKNELIRNFSNSITLKIENHLNSTSIIGNWTSVQKIDNIQPYNLLKYKK